MSATPHAPARAIRIAVLAMGGEGGGVGITKQRHQI